jgi:5-methylcytosine-specific restriction endonuclease McrBC GTP-binding regulatory subunit McrB
MRVIKKILFFVPIYFCSMLSVFAQTSEKDLLKKNRRNHSKNFPRKAQWMDQKRAVYFFGQSGDI